MTSRVVVLRMDLAYGKRSFDVSRVIDFPGKKRKERTYLVNFVASEWRIGGHQKMTSRCGDKAGDDAY